MAIFGQFLFTTIVTSDLRLYKNFSLNRLTLSHTAYIFISLSLILVLPIFFHLHTHPSTIPQLLQTKLIQPVTRQVINQTIPDIQLPSITQQQISTTNLPEIPGFTPDQLKELINFELTNQLSPATNNQATTSASINNNQTPLPNLTEISVPSNLNREQLINQTQQQVTDQINRILNPVYPYLSYLISLAILLPIFQITSLLRPLIFIIPWLLFKLMLLLKIATITTRNEPVEILEV
jgi:hypothetical protein